jgi:hypothetical protein
VTVVERISLHLLDNIYEVRDAAAFALRIIYSDIETEQRKFLLPILETVKQLKNTNEFETYFKERKEFILQKVTENDNDFGFMREPELWEYVDGLVHLYKEVFSIRVFNKEASLNEIIDFMCLNYSKNFMTNMCKKTIWECLTVMFADIYKGEVETYFESIQKIVIKEIEGKIVYLIKTIRIVWVDLKLRSFC